MQSAATAASTAADAATSHARRGLLLYLVLTAVGSVVVEALLLRAHAPIDRQPGLVFALMWWPTVASMATRLIRREPLRDVAFRWGGRATLWPAAVAWAFPVVVGALAYGAAWTTGLAQFVDRPVPFGLVRDGPAAIRFALRLALALSAGVVLSAATAAGEEFGWRGYMLTRLVDARIARPVLVSGLIGAAWKLPQILSGQYASGSYPVLSAVAFVAVVVASAYVHAYARLASGSVWPAVIAHSTWNVVIQAVFDLAVRPTHASGLGLGESGLLVVAASVAVAFAVLPRRWVMRRAPGDVPEPLLRP